MKDYKLTIEDGVITWVENAYENGNPISGRLSIPKEVTAFDVDAWVFLGCEAESIVVDPENDVFSSAHNCLLSKDSDIEVYNSMPSILYPKKENLTITCPKESNVSSYCKKYGIQEV